jgi:periplasmic mercuric ion binding protein
MKTLKVLLTLFICTAIAQTSLAQSKTEKIKVAGECGMCKNKIEKAAKSAGASYASWSETSKVLTVKYNSRSSNTAKIEKAVAAVGYDTQGVKATDEAYSKLHSCCKYERSGSSDDAHKCCDSEKCDKADCMKDGKCTHATECCKGAACEGKDCCKKS